MTTRRPLSDTNQIVALLSVKISVSNVQMVVAGVYHHSDGSEDTVTSTRQVCEADSCNQLMQADTTADSKLLFFLRLLGDVHLCPLYALTAVLPQRSAHAFCAVAHCSMLLIYCITEIERVRSWAMCSRK